jgi:uncharacterized membrane protein YedE/YeeE
MIPAPWYLAGPLLGLLIVALRAAVNKPFGVLGGYIDLVEHTSQPQRLGISTFLLLGVVLGGALYAALFGVFSPSLTYTGGSVLPSGAILPFMVLLLAGVGMGVGARTAGGCTSGHGLTGMALGSPASIVATITFFATGVALAHLLSWF